MKREYYRLDGNPKRAIDALSVRIAVYGFRGVHWDFGVPIFEMRASGGRAPVAVCTVDYHDDHIWKAAHTALQPSLGF